MAGKVEWVEVARRGENHNVLFMDGLERALAASATMRPKHYRTFDAARWFGKQDIDEFVSFLKAGLERNPKFLIESADECEKIIDRTRAHADEAARTEFAAASNAELARAFRLFSKCHEQWPFPGGYAYIMINRFVPDEIAALVAQKIDGVEAQTRALKILFAADKETETGREKKDFLRLAIKILSSKLSPDSAQAKELLAKHLRRYAHLGLYYFRGAAYDERALHERIAHLTPAEAERKLAEQEAQDAETSEAEFEALLKKLAFSKEVELKIRGAKRYSFCSCHADESFGYAVHRLAPLWRELEKRFGVSHAQFVSTQETEVLALLEKNEKASDSFKKELDERQRDYALSLDDGIITLYSGASLARYAAAERKSESDYRGLRELRGQGASPGLARGRVALVKTTADLAKVKKGDILVTAATTPEFVPAMERACAIVTDEGGLLCHAAIVSRELGIPCVVGCRNAHKILRDGELVEVDAMHGVVKKID
jgi:phosphohistidine swiveling domain-containing protein